MLFRSPAGTRVQEEHPWEAVQTYGKEACVRPRRCRAGIGVRGALPLSHDLQEGRLVVDVVAMAAATASTTLDAASILFFGALTPLLSSLELQLDATMEYTGRGLLAALVRTHDATAAHWTRTDAVHAPTPT